MNREPSVINIIFFITKQVKELELDTLGEEKTALFVIISDTDATFNFVVSIMYSQLLNIKWC